MRSRNLVFLLIGLFAISSAASAAIFPSKTGDWPKNWPQELEPFRKTSTTLGVGTGIQENIYTIPFEDRESFEKIWPLLVKQTTPGSKIRLLVVAKKEHPTWGKFLKTTQPCVHVYAPSEGYSVDSSLSEKDREDYAKLIKDGKAIHASAPWPKELFSETGELPEYVVSIKAADGKLKWEAGVPGDEHGGFYNRARVDLELVIDGKMIDLNRIRFPKNVEIIDLRGEPADQTQ